MTNISERSVDLLDHIVAYDYYQHIFEAALRKWGVTKEQIRERAVSDYTLCRVWNAMWGGLPDHPAIQRMPFDMLCDLCESEPEDPIINGC